MSLSVHLEPTAAWSELRAELRRAVGDSTFEIWLASLELTSVSGHKIVLNAPAATHDWVSKRFGRVLRSSAQVVFGADAEVELTTRDARTQRRSRDRDRSRGPGPQEALELDAGALNPRYTFDQFIIGDGNRLAHAAALAVAEQPPGCAYNPLFLHAPPGLGKTHLLHAIGNYVQSFGAGATVRYTTAEAFTNQFIRALGSRSLDRFKHAYRDADVLLIDDVQFLASKAKTEEEFFHTFNAVYETGRQLVLTCDRLPRQLESIEERLRARFESGLVAVIEPPDFSTRVAILRKRAALDRVAVAETEVLELIAERVATNVRLLEGALIRIVAYHSLTQLPVNVELAQTVLDELHPRPTEPRTTPTLADVQRVVAERYGVTIAELQSSGRAARITWPRQIAIHLARTLTDASLHTIGQAFGGRNHATVLHACKRVEARLKDDQQAVDDLADLTAMLDVRRADRLR